MKTGDSVLISPEVTHKSDWIQGTVIDVEDNPFVGTVISAETTNGDIFFEKECLFKPAPRYKQITGYSYEPWHIRYIDDVALAKDITARGITLEEYLEENTSAFTNLQDSKGGSIFVISHLYP